jgi:hypothetical protein
MINEDELIYLCGKHIVKYDIATKKQTFITRTVDDEEVSSFNFYNKHD